MKIIIEKIKHLAFLTGPILVAKIGVPLRGVIVTWILSLLGTQALAAGTLAYTLLITLLTFFLGVLLSSVGVYVSYSTGANNKNEVAIVIQQGLWLGTLLSIPGMLLLYNATPILLLLGQDKEIAILAAQLSRGLAWVFIPYTVVVNTYKLFTNLKMTYIPMMYSLLSLVLTIVCSYVLSFGNFGFPQMGISGIGIGIAIAYWVQAFVILLHVHFGKSTKEYKIFKNIPGPKFNYLHKLWKIGWPVGLKYNIEFLLFFVIAVIIGAMDNKDLSVYQVVLQFFMLSSCLASGVGLGAETLVGQAIGGNQQSSIKPSCYAGIILSIMYVTISAITIFIFRDKVSQIFFPQGTYDFDLLISLLGLVIIFQFLDSIRKVVTDILVVFKDSRFPLTAEIVGFWIISLPLGYLIGINKDLGVRGFLIALLIGVSLSLATMLLRLHKQLNQYLKQPTSVN